MSSFVKEAASGSTQILVKGDSSGSDSPSGRNSGLSAAFGEDIYEFGSEAGEEMSGCGTPTELRSSSSPSSTKKLGGEAMMNASTQSK
jgi:hypothetical protein